MPLVTLNGELLHCEDRRGSGRKAREEVDRAWTVFLSDMEGRIVSPTSLFQAHLCFDIVWGIGGHLDPLSDP